MRLATAIGLGLLLLAAPSARAADLNEDLPGTYTIVGGEEEGKPAPDRIKGSKVVITKDRITTFDEDGKEVTVIEYTLDASKTPCRIRMTVTTGPEGSKGSKAEGVIGKDGETVTIAYGFGDGKAPTSLEAKTGEDQHKFVMKRK